MRTWLASLMLLGLVGCGTVTGGTAPDDSDGGNLTACETESDCPPEEAVCDPDTKTCRGCLDNGECTANPAGQLCDTESGRCVQCLGNSDCTLSTSNICDPETLECRGCQAHDECASQFCDIDTSTCVDEGDIIYVDGDANDFVTCGTKTNPCKTVTSGVSKLAAMGINRQYLRILPSTTPYSARAAGFPGQLYVLAEGADFEFAKVTATGVGFLTLSAAGPVTWEGGSFSGSEDPIFQVDGGNLTLTHATFSGVNLAAKLNTGTLEVIESECTGGAVCIEAATAQSLRVERCRFFENTGSTIVVANTNARIRNNLFVRNGTALGYTRTIASNTSTSNILHEISYNTFSRNLTGYVAIISASGSGKTHIASNIIWQNDPDGWPTETSASTTFASNIIDATGALPAETSKYDPNTKSSDPQFSNPMNDIFTLSDQSPAVNAGDVLAAPPEDLVGAPRPIGPGPDIGCFERTL